MVEYVGKAARGRHRFKAMDFTPYIDTLGQSAFDWIVEELTREITQDSDFEGYHFNEDWIDRNLPEFYEGWDELSDDQRYQVVVDVKEQVAQSFDSPY